MLPHIELMRGHFLFQTVGLLFSSALSFERFCDGPAFKLAAAAFVGRRSALQAYALSQPVKKPLMGFASMALIRCLGVCAISSICACLVRRVGFFCVVSNWYFELMYTIS